MDMPELPAEELDEDSIGVDPLEEGIDPAEHWSGVDRHGTTPHEQREGETLDERLEEEVPDTEPDLVPERPRASTPDSELDETIDEDPTLTEDDDLGTQREPEEFGPVLVSEEIESTGFVHSTKDDSTIAAEDRAERIERW
ncbi:hypothetical protein [Allokutzneria oryzae]|uniref:DUF5709 domain-containing protein n=1 Tax=Allokutzneria oryzae TaxID=1378989 RepID=A0ABV5ZRD1_9PSEU